MRERRRRYLFFLINGKMKTVLPSLREKKRYLVFEVISKENMTQQDVAKAIEEKSARFLGDEQMSKAALTVMDLWNQDKRRGVVRVNRKYVEKIKAAMLLITKIAGTDAIIKSVGVSGILKKAQKKYM